LAIHKTVRQQQADTHRLALLDAAQELFLQYSVETITIDDICAHCGVTKGTFYHNFPSKDHIVALTVNTMLDAYIAEHFVLQPDKTLPDQITELFMYAFTFFKMLGKDMTRKSYEAQVRFRVELRIEGRTFVDSLYALVDRGLKEDVFLMGLDRFNTYMMFIATYTGMLMKWSTQSDELDVTLNWEDVMCRQIGLMTGFFPDHDIT